MKKGRAFIGTSGWHYKHWKDVFYPHDTPEKDQFNFYCEHFDTVELNNSFYMLPKANTFAGWKKKAPSSFVFSVKASRYITHMKKLAPEAGSMRKFFTRAGKLGKKLGPILFQLPPRWNVNTERLSTFLTKLPKGHQYTFEFRNHSWYNDEVYQLLREHNCAFCIYELQKHMSPIEETADFVYVRLHGPGNKYQGSYTDDSLKKWAKYCKSWLKDGKDVYVYFDNDQKGYAIFNALRLTDLVQ